jgi:hypothetical protein
MPMPVSKKSARCEGVESDADLPETESATPAGGELRAFPRFPFRGRAKAVVFPPSGTAGGEPDEYEVITTDVCRGGLSLLHRKQLFPGQLVLLVLQGSSRLMEVRWCCRIWQGLYSAGCKFVAEPPPAEEA